MYAKFAYSCYKELFSAAALTPELIGESVPLPRFDEKFVLELVNEAKSVLMEGSPIVHISSELIVVGDLHGNFHDLLRILAVNGLPPFRKYLFLGDYVDRGEFSLDVIFFLYVLKINFPNHVTLIRGNHEFPAVNKLYGFYANIMKIYDSDAIWEAFNDSFNYLPICAFIDEQILCLHGGISMNVKLDSLNELSFPITKPSNLIEDIVWSDPSENISTYIDNQRGKGVKFGAALLSKFMKTNGIKLLIRAHQCVDGYKSHFNNAVLTVFSSSCYGDNQNRGGFAYIDDTLSVKCDRFHGLKTKIILDEASFMPIVFNPQPQEENKLHRSGTLTSQIPLHLSLSKQIFHSGQLNLRRKVVSLPVKVQRPIVKTSFSANSIIIPNKVQKVSKSAETLLNGN